MSNSTNMLLLPHKCIMSLEMLLEIVLRTGKRSIEYFDLIIASL